MNIENLKTGQVFKNYKELCATLGIEPKEGNSKIKQFNDLSRWCTYKKDGRKIIIEEVFSSEKEHIETRGGANNSVYGSVVQLLILDLVSQNDGFVSLTKDKLFEQLGMTNKNYQGCKSNVAKLSQYINIDAKVILDFYNINNNNFKSVMITALDSLMDKRVLFYNTVIKIKELGGHIYRNATQEELSIISLVENKTLQKFGYERMSEVRKSSDWYEFKRVTKELIGSLTEVDYYFTAYDISSNVDGVASEKDKLVKFLLTSNERETNKVELNNMLIENIDKNATKRFEKAKSIAEISLEDELVQLRANEEYPANINELSTILIKRDYNYIMNELSKVEIVKPKVDSNIPQDLF